MSGKEGAANPNTRHALTHATQATMITDAEGVITFVNPAFERLTGFSAAEALGRKPSILKSGLHHPRIFQRMWQALLRGETWSDTLINRRADGSFLRVHATLIPLREAGAISGFLSILRPEQEGPVASSLQERFAGLWSAARDVGDDERSTTGLDRLAGEALAVIHQLAAAAASCIGALHSGNDEQPRIDVWRVHGEGGAPVERSDGLPGSVPLSEEQAMKLLKGEAVPLDPPMAEALLNVATPGTLLPLMVGERAVAVVGVAGSALDSATIAQARPLLALAGRTLLAAVDYEDARREAEALRLQQAHLADAQRLAGIGSWRWQTGADLVEGSEEAYRILGQEDHGPGIKVGDILARIPAPDRDRIAAVVQQLLAGESPGSVTVRIRHASGEERTIRVKGEASRDRQGNIEALVGNVHDVTAHAQVKAESDLRDAAIHSSLSAVAMADLGRRLTYVNEAFTTMWGFDNARTAMGIDVATLWEDSRKASGAMDAVLMRGAWSGELWARRNDGLRFAAEVRASLARDAQDAPSAMMLSVNDISARKEAEAQQVHLQELLLRASGQWRRTFDALEFPLLVLGRDGRIRRLNESARRLTGRPFDELIGTRIETLAASEPWRTMTSLAEAFHRDGRSQAGDARQANGRVWSIRLQAFALDHVGEGQTGESAVLAVLRDTSQVSELQESLRRTEVLSAMGSLVAGVAHEVRNPLFSISAALDAFEARHGANNPGQRFLDILRTQVDRMSQLMQDLLDYGRPLRLAPETVPADVPVARAIRLCGVLADQSGIEIRAEVADEIPTCHVDPEAIVNVYQNLIQNALQFSPPNSQVIVRVRPLDAHHTAVEVIDAGPGFGPEALDRLFEPFFTRRKGGTGLGLSIVEKLVRAHNGRVEALNVEQGGACVRVILPAKGE